MRREISTFVVPPPVNTTDVSNDDGTDDSGAYFEGFFEGTNDTLASLENLKLHDPKPKELPPQDLQLKNSQRELESLRLDHKYRKQLGMPKSTYEYETLPLL